MPSIYEKFVAGFNETVASINSKMVKPCSEQLGKCSTALRATATKISDVANAKLKQLRDFDSEMNKGLSKYGKSLLVGSALLIASPTLPMLLFSVCLVAGAMPEVKNAAQKVEQFVNRALPSGILKGVALVASATLMLTSAPLTFGVALGSCGMLTGAALSGHEVPLQPGRAVPLAA